MSAVPAATRRCRSSGCASSVVRTPTSTTVTLAPTCRAKALTTAPPARKFATICAVTSCGHGVTPWACTPWSPAKIATAAGWGNGGGHDPAMPARATARSSTRPSAPRGLVMRSNRSRAAARASALTGRTAATVSATRSDIRRADHAAAVLVNATSVSREGLTRVRNRDSPDNGRPIGWAVRHREVSPVSGTVVVLIIVVLLIVVVLGVVLSRRRRSSQLQEHFGPEYERSVSATGDRRAAEAELAERRQRREEFDVRDLRPEERDRFRDSWNEIQRGFVDDPRRSLKSADLLVAEVMRARGYPVDDDFDRRADDLSVDHPRVVQHYREARKVRDDDGEVDTERQRTAVTSYRSLINALLGDDDRTHDADRADARPDDRRPDDQATDTRPAGIERTAPTDTASAHRQPQRPAGTPCATTSPERPAPPTRGRPGAPRPRSTRDDHVRPAHRTARQPARAPRTR